MSFMTSMHSAEMVEQLKEELLHIKDAWKHMDIEMTHYPQQNKPILT